MLAGYSAAIVGSPRQQPRGHLRDRVARVEVITFGILCAGFAAHRKQKWALNVRVADGGLFGAVVSQRGDTVGIWSYYESRKIAATIVLEIQGSGFADGLSCWQQREHCTQLWHDDRKHALDSEKDVKNCNLLSRSVCDRAYKISIQGGFLFLHGDGAG